VGLEYHAGLVIRDQTETGVGSKKLVLEYDFGANLVQPTAATRNLLRQELTVPFGGWAEPELGTETLVARAPVIPEHVTDLLANDLRIAAELRRSDTVMNTVSGIAGYYTVQIKMQALTLGRNGQWLRSPPFYMVIDLCDGCLTRIPQQLVKLSFSPTCRRTQDQISLTLDYPPFPDLSAASGGPEDENAPTVEIEVGNAGGTKTLGSLGAQRGGRSKAGIWIATPRHIGREQFPFNGIEVAQPRPFADCDIGNVEAGGSATCNTALYPRLCSDGSTGCRTDDDCAQAGGSCRASSNLRLNQDDEVIEVKCGNPEENQANNQGGDAGPQADGGGGQQAQADGGMPQVSCLYIVCADVDNEIVEWTPEAVSWEGTKSNCSCFSEDTELAQDGCPL
jgi:hypothetical protein